MVHQRLLKSRGLLFIPLLIVMVAAAACGSAEVAPTAVPIDTAALIQQAIQQAVAAQPAGVSPDDVAKAVQGAMANQPGVTADEVASAIASALAAQPGVTQDQVASAITGALQNTPGVTEAQVAAAIASALQQQAPGVTQEDIKAAVESAVSRAVEGVSAPPVPKGDIKLLSGKIPPVYGGTLRLALSNDGGINWSSCEFRQTRMLTHSVENFLLGDKRLGPAGTNETTFLPVLSLGTEKIAIGAMADRWDQPDSTTYRFHLRPGLRWQPKEPTNGRLVTVEELVAEFERIKDCRWPRHDFLDSVTAEDTDGDGIADSIAYNTNKPISFWGYEFAWGPYFLAAPPETIEAGTDKWETQSGTGPWMPSGYTAGTTVEFERNPDWYLTWTEEGREYNLPFMDKLLYIVIPQEANRLAALRTGKIDEIRGVRTIDRPQIEQSNPDLGSVLALESSFNYFMPMDKPPFDDLRVRLAMNYAIDRQVYTDALFGGNSVLLAHPLNPEWPAHYEPLDQQPQSVQDYFVYNPAKAEALLDEAGLTREGGDGVRFKIEMLIDNASQLQIELAEISISFWDDIGVVVTLDLQDPPVRQSRLFEKQFDFFGGAVAGRPNALNDFRLGHQWNRANLTDSVFIEMWEDVLTATDSQEQADLIKAASSKWLELAPAVQVPAGFGGDYWQPWVQNHGGERALAFVDYSTHWAYVWLDRNLRQERTGFND